MTEIDNEAVEAVKAAIVEVEDRAHEYEDWRTVQARAAITAMRNPTGRMLRAADDSFEDRHYDRRDDLREAYQAMIDEALRPAPPKPEGAE